MKAEHRRLQCGVELAVLTIAGRRVAAMGIRIFAGYAFEAPAHLGVAHVLNEAITKGTARRDGRALNDAFDEIGATHVCFAGRETIGFSCLCLPDFLGRAIELHAELIRTPTFPADACRVAVDLAQQALAALQDDPAELAKKLLHRQAYGESLGRHALGEAETLAAIGREQILEHCKCHFSARRMQVAVAGAVDPAAAADLLEREFDGFGDGDRAQSGRQRREEFDRPAFPLRFSPGRSHYPKELQQEQIAICFPGAAATDDDMPVEQVVVGLLSGGMSSRLWTAVRQKQGLVYSLGAWSDRPRIGGMFHLAASATPRHVEEVYETLLREVNQLAAEVTQQEIDRAVTGIVTQVRTRGDLTQARASLLVNDLFYYGRPIPLEEKLAKIRAVTIADVRRYLETHSRDRLSVVTLGPVGLNDE